MATTAGDEQTVQFMLKRWQDPASGLDEAWREEYMVYLSFPDPKNPNKVTVGESVHMFAPFSANQSSSKYSNYETNKTQKSRLYVNIRPQYMNLFNGNELPSA